MEEIHEYIDDHWMEAVEDLKRFCRQPGISAQGTGIDESVEFLVELMREYGIQTEVLPGEGFPFIYGELPGESRVTLLFYNHYDVQPPEPLELWSTPPFEPTVYDGNLRARGVSDDKGDIVARLLAIRAYLEKRGTLPVSVKFIIEGEEEIGSPHVAAFVEKHHDLLHADACIWECGGVNWKNQPVIHLGLKGMLYVQLEARGASTDLHSSMATVVPNPAWRLTWALNSIKDLDENIRIEGFYDDVRPPADEERRLIDSISLDEEETRQALSLDRFVRGVTGFEYKARHILEPTCNICGLDSGYTGPGSKTVLPNVARAKIDFRLVPDQRYDDILARLRRHLDSNGFEDILIDPQTEGENPARTPLDSPFVSVVAEAAREVYGLDPVLVPSMAGSGPMYSFAHTLRLPTALIGVAYPGSSPHAPDEHIRLADFVLNAKHIAAVLQNMTSYRQASGKPQGVP